MGFSFNADLQKAYEVEQEVIQMYIASGYTATSTYHLEVFAGYDIIVENHATIEVKNQAATEVTDNVAVELYKVIDGVKYKSGLTATTADFHVYKILGKFYIITTDKLKALLKRLKSNNALPIIKGGDNNSTCMALVSKYVFRKECQLL